MITTSPPPQPSQRKTESFHVEDLINKEKYPTIKSTRYVDNHLNVFKRIINLATTEFIWICSSICNYDNFKLIILA